MKRIGLDRSPQDGLRQVERRWWRPLRFPHCIPSCRSRSRQIPTGSGRGSPRSETRSGIHSRDQCRRARSAASPSAESVRTTSSDLDQIRDRYRSLNLRKINSFIGSAVFGVSIIHNPSSSAAAAETNQEFRRIQIKQPRLQNGRYTSAGYARAGQSAR